MRPSAFQDPSTSPQEAAIALITDTRFRAADASGDAYSGAKLYVYNANTLVLASIYTTAALSVALSNPVIADSNGVFAQIFGVEGLGVDLVLKTSGDITLYTQDDVVFVGANSGVISRDFTNSRLRIAGSGGIISVEAGDPSGDDVGGALRLGGYLSTQADTLSLDAAATNTTGKFTENSKKLPGIVYTEATTFTAVSALDVALPNDPVGCRVWQVDVWDYVQSANDYLQMRLSFDGGATYKSGASDYKTVMNYSVSGGSTVTAGTIVTSTLMQVAFGMVGVTNGPGHLSFKLITPRTGNDMTRVSGTGAGIDSTPQWRQFWFEGMSAASFGPVDHVRLFPASGTITGKYRVTPMRGYGET